MYPLIIPINTTPSKCPSCDKKEDIVETCNHCGYKYKKDKNIEFPFWWLSVLLNIATFYLMFYLISTMEGVLEWWTMPTVFVIIFGGIFIIISEWAFLAKDN